MDLGQYEHLCRAKIQTAPSAAAPDWSNSPGSDADTTSSAASRPLSATRARLAPRHRARPAPGPPTRVRGVLDPEHPSSYPVPALIVSDYNKPETLDRTACAPT